MSDQEKNLILQQEITKIESQVATIQESLDSIKETLKYLKDIAWDRDSKKESSKMYKVLENDKPSTIVKSNVGDVIVDREFMEKEIHKHLDNPAKRGMLTKQELLSFSKVAKKTEAKYEERQQGYTWKAKADDGSILNYGERDYGQGHRLLTAHSKTERGERGQLRREFNDRDFHNSAGETIPQNTNNASASLPNVPDSAIAKMKQKCEAYVQNGFHKENPKHQTKDKGAER